MIGITGKQSSITQSFIKLINEDVVYGTTETLPLNLNSYLLCAGVLVGKDAQSISDTDARDTFHVNFLNVIRFCDKVFTENKHARICVIGSESGFKGSYDMVYAGSKVALHLYVESKKLQYPEQHLVCVAPTIIEDSGMTQRRKDLTDVIEKGKKRRMGRWLLSDEVARVAYFALHEPSLSNTIIRMTGGNY